MADSKWTVSCPTKRKTPASESKSQKRQRLQEEVEGPSTVSKRRCKQQTLTQTQWIPPGKLPRYDDNDLKPLDAEDKKERSSKPRSRLKKRDSTLTQMDFFSTMGNGDRLFEDEYLRQDIGAGNQHHAIPQTDGTWESPRRPRHKRKLEEDPTRTVDAHNEGSKRDGAEHIASKRRKTNSKDIGQASTRRQSARLALKTQVFSDPKENFDYFQDVPSHTKRPRDTSRPVEKVPVLEIKESTGLSDIENRSQVPQQSSTSALPQTPRKQRTVILSSQSPESLPSTISREKKKRFKSSPAVSVRAPLQPLSTNTTLPGQTATPAKSASQRRTRRSPKRRTVTLKMPRERGFFRKKRVEDSQADVFDIPETSSPEISMQPIPSEVVPPEVFDTVEARNGTPTNTQVQDVSPDEAEPMSHHTETQETLPSLSDLVGTAASAADEDTDVPIQPGDSISGGAAVSTENVVVRDFAVHPVLDTMNIHADVRDEHEAAPVVTVITPRKGTGHEENIFDMDSPILNDTQYTDALAERSSSPGPLADLTPERTPTQPKLSSVDVSPPHSQTALNSQGSKPLSRQTSKTDAMSDRLPVPTLVPSPSFKTPRRAQSTTKQDSSTQSLPKLPSKETNGSHISSVRVPLNDTQIISSSPILPATKMLTQKSIRPASLPRPSQISTQEATQPYFAMSSIPIAEHDDDDGITIKDSSSIRVRLSQLPHYQAGQSQFVLEELDEINDSEDDEDDLDLNPRARKAEDLTRTTSNLIDILPQISPPSKRNTQVKPEVYDEEIGSQGDPRNVEDSQIVSPSQPRALNDLDEEHERSSPKPEHWEHIPGFDNDTPSNFTQNGHVTAAFIHRQRDIGAIPRNHIPKPYQVKGYRRGY